MAVHQCCIQSAVLQCVSKRQCYTKHRHAWVCVRLIVHATVSGAVSMSKTAGQRSALIGHALLPTLAVLVSVDEKVQQNIKLLQQCMAGGIGCMACHSWYHAGTALLPAHRPNRRPLCWPTHSCMLSISPERMQRLLVQRPQLLHLHHGSPDVLRDLPLETHP